MDKNELESSYRNGVYYLINSGIYIQIDEINTEIDHILEDYHGSNWAFITAWNPGGKELKREENLERQIKLLLDIKDHVIMEGRGESSDETWAEDSFFVIDISKDSAIKLCQKYGQAAFLYGEKDQPGSIIFL